MNLKLAADTVRLLSADAVQQAKSGHPGMPMGTADFAVTLFLKHLSYSPSDPAWPDRDRFVLSAGHGCMLLYSLLHLSGYALPMDELKRFRQWGSLTPGHPEFGHTPGVETSTGPLGQGCGNAVGMALAEAMLAARFNSADIKLVDHYTYALCSDGDLMEGVSHEAFSLAGHLRLNKLILFYDSNRITIEGCTDLAYSDDVRKRFEGYHWNVLDIDGHDFEAIDAALLEARNSDRPTIIIGRTRIAKGSPNMEGSAEAHGAPLGVEELKATKRALGFPEDKSFHVPGEVSAMFAERAAQLEDKRRQWLDTLARFRKASPAKAAEWDAFQSGKIPKDLAGAMPAFDVAKPVATRSAGHKALQGIAGAVPWLVGGSADLSPSTRTTMDEFKSVAPGDYSGRNLHFGVREHAMGAILNGIALHGGLRPYGSTFFVFADYFRPSIRLAAIMKLPVIYVLTHDSFYVGEDGPTHQPVEHLGSLRIIPGMTVIRPADAAETAAAWVVALKNTGGPTAIILTRHNVPVLDRTQYPEPGLIEQGAYVLWQSGEGIPKLMLIASGSEVHPALAAARLLAAENVNVRVVNMASWELFERLSKRAKNKILPPRCKARLVVEAGCSMGWEKYAGLKGRILGFDRFGASAPYADLEREFGFTPENIANQARALL